MRGHKVAWLVSLIGALALGCGGGSGDDDGGGMVGDGGGGGGLDSGMPPGMDAGPGPGDDGGGVDAGGDRPDPTCTDGEQNGSETDVDCGGNICPTCGDGAMCVMGSDCTSAVCTGGTCTAPTCTDAVQNQDETAADCGGAICDGCADGEACTVGTDCTSGVCDPTMMVCVPAGCTDGARNGDETDVDCGGSCGPCGVGRSCGEDGDCASGFCDPATSTCQTPTCTDTIQNQDETGVDCGGLICAGCATGGPCLIGADCASGVCDPATMLCVTPSCSDGIQNAAETGIDCGGGTCPACSTGGGCTSGADCASGVCVGMMCAAASCTDGVQNGAETGLDCGGGCAGCPTGGECTTGSDCASGVCVGTMCAAATCTDSVQNGAETAVDCGGGTCPACAAGDGCGSDADCASGVCDPATMTCSTAGCMDGVRNGAETAIDCGGGTCPGCPDGGPCGADEDCLSGSCDPTTMTCDMPSCTDAARNGDETDVDCGGPLCPACRPGEDCLLGRDCSSGICGGGSMTCNAPTCSDGVLNGTETDVDCGGSSCTPCDPGDSCLRPTDCSSGVCDPGTRRCLAPTCTDGVRNGGETAVDCGGTCPACWSPPDRVLIHLSADTFSNPAAAAAARMGATTITTTRTVAEFNAAFDAGGWDIVVLHVTNGEYDSTVWDRALAHHAGGGRVNLSFWNLDATPQLLTGFGVTAAEYNVAQSVFPRSAASVDLFSLVETITPPMTAVEADYWIDNGDFLTGGTSLLAAGSATGSSLCQALGGRTLINGFLPDDFRNSDGDADGVQDVIELMVNQFAYQMGAR